MIPTPPTQLVEIAGDRLILNLHPGQAKVWDSTARFTVMLAGAQGGKTSLGPHWLRREIERKGKGDYLAVTATYDLFNLKMLPALLDLFEGQLGWGRYWGGDKIIELANPATGKFGARSAKDQNRMWGRIILRSASAPGSLESSTAKAAWLDEAGQDAFTILAWDAVLRRLALNRGRVLITTTPYNLGWLKQQLYDPWTKGRRDIRVVQFESVLNPTFPREEFDERRDTMPAWKFNMWYRGILERPAGMIYTDFIDKFIEEGGHKAHSFIVPRDWQRFAGVDPGIIHTAKLYIAQDPNANVYYAYREQFGDRTSAQEHARLALADSAERGEPVTWWAVGAKSEIYWRDDWRKAGAGQVLEPLDDAVELGIDRVTRLLRQRRLFVTEDCRLTLDQFGTYARALDANDQPTEAIKDKEQYHFMDALRYAAQHLDPEDDDAGVGVINYAQPPEIGSGSAY